MATRLRLILDQVASPTDRDLASASAELARALVASTPRGCEVSAVVPASASAIDDVHRISGLAEVETSRIPRRELATAVSLGLPSGLGSGMLHSPTLFAPLVRHDRVHRHEQTVITVWDTTPWIAPESLPKGAASWHRSMRKRAERYADAVVVPLHSMAQELAEHTKFGDRLRVIAGAAPERFAAPSDAVGRRRELGAQEGAVVVDAATVSEDELDALLAALLRELPDAHCIVLDAAGARPTAQVTFLAGLDTHDRAAVLSAASALVAPSPRHAYGWRIHDALALGVPVVAEDSVTHRELLADGGVTAAGAEGLAAAVAAVLRTDASVRRAVTVAADRGRAFSWREAGERVWQLHAEL